MESSREANPIPFDTAIGPDEWRTVEQGAHEVQEAVSNAFEFSELPSDPPDRHGADKRARELVGKANDAMVELAEFSNMVAEKLEEEDGGD